MKGRRGQLLLGLWARALADWLVRLDRLFGWPVDLPYDDDLIEDEGIDEVPFPGDEDYPGEEVDRGLLETLRDHGGEN